MLKKHMPPKRSNPKPLLEKVLVYNTSLPYYKWVYNWIVLLHSKYKLHVKLFTVDKKKVISVKTLLLNILSLRRDPARDLIMEEIEEFSPLKNNLYGEMTFLRNFCVMFEVTWTNLYLI